MCCQWSQLWRPSPLGKIGVYHLLESSSTCWASSLTSPPDCRSFSICKPFRSPSASCISWASSSALTLPASMLLLKSCISASPTSWDLQGCFSFCSFFVQDSKTPQKAAFELKGLQLLCVRFEDFTKSDSQIEGVWLSPWLQSSQASFVVKDRSLLLSFNIFVGNAEATKDVQICSSSLPLVVLILFFAQLLQGRQDILVQNLLAMKLPHSNP